jgi:hypothetical protein
MKLNRIKDGDVQTFMHESVASANAPEWSGSNLVCCVLARVLDDAVSSANVV